MSISYNTSIVRDGLVFHSDMGNTAKSYKGRPTINLIGNGCFANGSGIENESGSYGTNTIVQFPNPGETAYCLRQGPGSGEYEVHPRSGAPLVANTTYCMSYWVAHTPDFDGNTMVDHSRWYDSSGAAVSTTGGGSTLLETRVVGGLTWERRYTVFTSGSTSNGGYDWYIGYPTGNTKGYRYITGVQLEAASYPSPFANNTRTSSQAILDLTNLNTITVNNLTYNTDNTYSFNNIQTSALTCPDSSILKPSNVTIIAWVYMSTFNPLNDFDGSYPTIVWKCNDGNSGGAASYGLSLAAGGGLPRFTIAPTQLISTTPITVGVWTMLTGVYNFGSMKLYKNDTLDISTTGPASISYTTQVLSVGTRVFNGAYQFPWNGKIGVVKLYNRALTAVEVAQNFNAYRDRYGI